MAKGIDGAKLAVDLQMAWAEVFGGKRKEKKRWLTTNLKKYLQREMYSLGFADGGEIFRTTEISRVSPNFVFFLRDLGGRGALGRRAGFVQQVCGVSRDLLDGGVIFRAAKALPGPSV